MTTTPAPTKINELRQISPEIADYIERYYGELPSETPFLDITTPHHMAHQVAARWSGLGAAFYLLVADAARECFSRSIGMPMQQPQALPYIPTGALSSLINSKDSSWF